LRKWGRGTIKKGWTASRDKDRGKGGEENKNEPSSTYMEKNIMKGSGKEEERGEVLISVLKGGPGSREEFTEKRCKHPPTMAMNKKDQQNKNKNRDGEKNGGGEFARLFRVANWIKEKLGTSTLGREKHEKDSREHPRLTYR